MYCRALTDRLKTGPNGERSSKTKASKAPHHTSSTHRDTPSESPGFLRQWRRALLLASPRAAFSGDDTVGIYTCLTSIKLIVQPPVSRDIATERLCKIFCPNGVGTCTFAIATDRCAQIIMATKNSASSSNLSSSYAERHPASAYRPTMVSPPSVRQHLVLSAPGTQDNSASACAGNSADDAVVFFVERTC